MKAYLFLFLSFAVTISQAQTKLSGRILDGKGEGIPYCNIFLKDTYDGATTNENGTFTFHTSEKGTFILIVKALGFHDFEKSINLDGSAVSMEVNMKEQINELNAVTISAGSFTASDQGRRTVFRALDIASTAGATADIAGVLNTLPGTQKVGEQGRLFVRGGDGSEVRTFVDGMLVLDAYSPAAPNTPSRGRFLPFMFKGTSFSTGGYSAEFGQALSSVLALDSRDELNLTRTDIGILSVGGDVAHTQVWKGGSIGTKIQYTNLRPYTGLIDQEIDWRTPPASMQGITAFRQKVGKTGMVKVFGNFSRSDFSLHSHDIDDYTNTQLLGLTNDYSYLNAFYKDELNKNWMVRGGLSYTTLKNRTSADQNRLNETERGVHAKAVLEGSISEHVEIKSGLEVISRGYKYLIASFDQQASASAFNEVISSGFAEADLYASNSFVTRIGLRAEHNSLTQALVADPRISLAYKAGKDGQFSVAYGKFRQSPKNEFLRIDNALASEKADHYIINYQRISNDRTFRVESYYKKYNDLIKTNGNLDNSGSGYARGFEFFWRDKQSVDKLDYWVSYSFLDTERDYLNFPTTSVPSFASKHNFSVVTKYFIVDMKSQVGATWSYASGRPYHDPNRNGFNQGKTPSYQDLSFNWSYLPKPYLIIHFSCTNLLGRDNIFGYEYSGRLNENGVYNSRAIRQPAPRFVFLGIFITLSKEKSINQLPTL